MNDEKNSFRPWLLIAAAVLLLAVTGWLARTPYHHYKERRSLKQAQADFALGDYRNALLSVSQTLALNPSNAPAYRVMANLADLSRSPASLDWHRRLVELQPTAENKLALAAAGLRYQNAPFPLTVQILGDLAATATNLVAYHIVGVELAFKMNDLAAAQAHLNAAAQLEPTNPIYRLNLAVLRLISTNPAYAGAARATLEQFRSDTNFAATALRALVTDRLTHEDLTGAHNYSTQLLASAQATIADRLQYLGVWKNSKVRNCPLNWPPCSSNPRP